MKIQVFISVVIGSVLCHQCQRNNNSTDVQSADESIILHSMYTENSSASHKRFASDDDIEYWLYTRKNPKNGQRIYKRNNVWISASYFDPKKPVKFTVHGWNGDFNSSVNIYITAAYLRAMDVNVIVVDWSKASGGGYASAVSSVPQVGASVGDFVDWLVELGSYLGKMHIMGYSLGGQLVGFVGRSVKSGLVGYITALDPANPSWGPTSERLRPSDARYVEVVHTNSGRLGVRDPLGHNDFYPNGGTSMPGCEGINAMACSHYRSYQYLVDSIDHDGFMARQCASVEDALANICSGSATMHMGGARRKPAIGIFALSTNAEEPYYKN